MPNPFLGQAFTDGQDVRHQLGQKTAANSRLQLEVRHSCWRLLQDAQRRSQTLTRCRRARSPCMRLRRLQS